MDTGMSIGMYIDMCAGMHADHGYVRRNVYGHVCRLLHRHLHRHVCRHVYAQVHAGVYRRADGHAYIQVYSHATLSNTGLIVFSLGEVR